VTVVEDRAGLKKLIEQDAAHWQFSAAAAHWSAVRSLEHGKLKLAADYQEMAARCHQHVAEGLNTLAKWDD
jgi:hypothetical protein